MLIPARSLAEAVASAYVPNLPADMVENLALAISDPPNVVVNELFALAVLRPVHLTMAPGSPQFWPTLVEGRISKQKKHRRSWTTRNLARFLRYQANPTERITAPKGFHAGWAAARFSAERGVPIGGDLPEPAAFSGLDEPCGGYRWFNLDYVPIGGIVYHIQPHGDGQLFQRLTSDRWGRLGFNGRQDAGNLHGVLRTLEATHGERITGIAPIEGGLPFFRRPPDPRSY